MAQLAEFGFPEIRAKRALVATNHAGAEVAMGWLFEHMEDPGQPDPVTSFNRRGSNLFGRWFGNRH